jgi:ribosome-binding factor A
VIKKIIGSKMRLKHMPEITYVYDKTGENVARIGEILNRLKDKQNE